MEHHKVTLMTILPWTAGTFIWAWATSIVHSWFHGWGWPAIVCGTVAFIYATISSALIYGRVKGM